MTDMPRVYPDNSHHREGCTCAWCEDVRNDTLTRPKELNGSYPTHEDLAAETKTVLAVLNREMEKVRDQLYHLNRQDTMARMAAIMWTNSSTLNLESAADMAVTLYREVGTRLKNTGEVT